MLYNLDFLSKQANPLVHWAWIAGTRGLAAAPSKPKLKSSELLQLCDIISSFMSSKSNEAKDRFSVRMSHTLMLGMLDLFINMVDTVIRNMDEDLKRKSSIVKITEIQDEESPEITAVAAKKKSTKVRAEKRAPPAPLKPLEEDVLATANMPDVENRARRITLTEDLPVQRMEEDEQQFGLEPIPDATRLEVQAEVHMAQETQIPEDQPVFSQVQANVHDTELGTREIPMEVEEIPAVPEVSARRTTREHSGEFQPLPIEVHAVEPQRVRQLPEKREKRHLLHKQNFLSNRKVLTSHINQKETQEIQETLEEPLGELLQVGDDTGIKAILIKKGIVLGRAIDEPVLREASVRSSHSRSSFAVAAGTSVARETPTTSLLRRTGAGSLPELQVTHMEEIISEPVLIASSPKEIDQRAEESWSAPQMEHADITEVAQLEPEHQLTHRKRMIRQLRGDSLKIGRFQKILNKVHSWNFENKLTIEDFVGQPLRRSIVALVFFDLLDLQALGYTKMHPQENSYEVDHITKGPKFDQSFEF